MSKHFMSLTVTYFPGCKNIFVVHNELKKTILFNKIRLSGPGPAIHFRYLPFQKQLEHEVQDDLDLPLEQVVLASILLTAPLPLPSLIAHSHKHEI